MNEMIIGGLLGLASGFAVNRLALFQTGKRVGKNEIPGTVGSVSAAVVMTLVTGVLFAIIFRLNTEWPKRIEYAAYVLTAVGIGVVDLGIKKIPNASVLALLAVRTVAVIYELVTGGSVKETLLPSVIGLFAAFILYQLPMLIGIPIGAGDIKYASAIGFTLGIAGFLQASLIMALGLAVLLVILKATKKGSSKTKVPMGPFLSAGAVATIMFPVLSDYITSRAIL